MSKSTCFKPNIHQNGPEILGINHPDPPSHISLERSAAAGRRRDRDGKEKTKSVIYNSTSHCSKLLSTGCGGSGHFQKNDTPLLP